MINRPPAHSPSRPATKRAHPGRPHAYWRWLPGLATLRHYQRPWLRDDCVAGLVLTAVLIPVGMGYAQAAGLPAITGLYTTILGLLAYALMGPSRILILGPDSALAPLILAVILPIAAGNPARVIGLAGGLAICTGFICVVAGLARLGVVTELISTPIRSGYMNGIALTVFISQLPKLCGFTVHAQGVFAESVAFIVGAANGRINGMSLALGILTLMLVLGTKPYPRLPGTLIALGSTILCVSLFDLAHRAGVIVIGAIPRGLPSFAVPTIALPDVMPLVMGALTIAIVSLAETSVLSRALADKAHSQVDPNQELIALGVANISAGLFHGFAVSSSSSRTPVAEAAGAKTQVSGIVGALAIMLLLILAPNLLQNIPNAALGAIVMVAAVGLVEVTEWRRLYRIQRNEFWLAVACCGAVALLGPIPGILSAIVVSLGEFIWHAWRPHYAVLGRVEGMKGYHDITRHPLARLAPGLLLFRWDAPLFYANAEQFRRSIMDAIATSPVPVKWVVVAAEPITNIDVTAADMLVDFDRQLHQEAIILRFAELKGPVKDTLKRLGVFTQPDEHPYFPTIGAAVKAYIASSGIDWVDWEDRPAQTRS